MDDLDKTDDVELEVGLEEETPDDLEEISEGEDGDQGQEEDEIEIVLEGDDGSQPDQSNLGIRKRINKLNAKVSDAQDGATQANSELAAEREKNKLLQMALSQQKEAAAPSGPPDPLDFDEGARDTKYIAALDEYTDKRVQVQLAKQVRSSEPTVDRDLEVKQTQHYEAAGKLNIRDYDEIEDVAIGILGKEAANEIIKKTANSPVLFYHLGKFPDKAERIADLLKRDPIKGVMEIGALSAKLKVNKVKRNQAPDPDGELQGTSSPRKESRGPKGATFT